MDKAVFARNPDSLVAVSHLLTRASFLRRLNEDALPVTAHTLKLLYCKYEDLRKSRGDMAKIELSKGEADVLIYACKAVKEEYFSLPEFEHLCATCDSQIKYWQSVYRVVDRGYKRYTAEQLKLMGDILDMILGDVDYRRGKWLLAHILPPIKEKIQERIEYGPSGAVVGLTRRDAGVLVESLKYYNDEHSLREIYKKLINNEIAYWSKHFNIS